MPKFWLPTEEQNLLPKMNEKLWFKVNQKLLLGMANTDYGKDLLCIDKNIRLPIIGIKKNEVRYLAKVEGDIATCVSDFRVGAKWANVVRSRWEQFNSYARYFQANAAMDTRFISPLTLSKRAVFALTLTAYPDPDPETTTVDGSVLNGGSSTWATVHGGTSGSDGAYPSGGLGYIYAGKEGGGTFQIGRFFHLYDTASLPDDATIQSATVSLDMTTLGNGDNDGDDWVNIVPSTPASNTNLVVGDFDQCGAISDPTEYATRIDITGMTANVYTVWTLNATGLSNISLTGITKFGAREGHDAINSAYAGSSGTLNQAYPKTADTAGTSSDPKLVVEYTVGGARSRLLLLGVS